MVTSILPLLLLGLFSVYFVSDLSINQIETRVSESLSTSVQLIDGFIEQFNTKVDDLSKNPELFEILSKEVISESDKNKIYQYLYGAIENQTAQLSMFVIKKDGTFNMGTMSVPQQYDIRIYRNWGIFYFLENQQQRNIFPHAYSENGHQNSISIARKIVKDDETVGYLILDISTKAIESLVSNVKKTSYGLVQLVIVSQSNYIIYNDSIFGSSIGFYNTIFMFDRFSANRTQFDNQALENLYIDTAISDTNHYRIYGIVPMNLIADYNRQMIVMIIFLVTMAVILSLAARYIISKRLASPIVELANHMKLIGQGQFSGEAKDESNTEELSFIIKRYNKMIWQIRDLHKNDMEKQDKLRISEIKTLQSQINPHFLYNTLDTIKWKSKLEGAEEVAQIATELGKILKITMDTDRAIVSLEQELSFIRSYFNIMKIRYQQRMEYIIDADSKLNHYMLPKLLIQPLVENAFAHGIESLNKHGIIKVNVYLNKYLTIDVCDNGNGFFETKEEFFQRNDGLHIGLKNIDDRIKLHYGEEFGLSWFVEEGWTVFRIILPSPKKGDDLCIEY
ncbi:MAG: histidine kinase [Erysipelothrix sp.]|nr:histidine kinase [Erysipelothrix sp.]